jgi:HAD superfamily hydrolase (TIGR01450 family)
VVATLRRLERRLLFLSNNPTSTPETYAAKLTRLGIPVAPGEVLNTVTTMVRWLSEHHPGATVFPIAEAPLIEALCAAGFPLSEDPAAIDVVIASYDRGFDYRKLQIAFDALWFPRRARLVATNPDRYCPFPGGRGQPDAGAIVAAIEACTGVRCEAVTGKPDPYMLTSALAALDLPAADCLMTGDRLYTDIRMARDAGAVAVLTLTGETKRTDVEQCPQGQRPDLVITDLGELSHSLESAHQGNEAE